MAVNHPLPAHAVPSAAKAETPVERWARAAVQWLRPYAGYLLVFLAATGAYLNSIPNEYTFDDHSIVQNDARVRQLSHFSEFFTTSYWDSPDRGGEYRPLVILSFALNYAMNHLVRGSGLELEPYSFHLANVLLHALASVLAAWAVLALFKRKTLAIATGLLFALHPIHTEAVSGLVGRSEILSAIGFFAALGAWGKLRESHLRGTARWLLLLALTFAFGGFSKENAMTLPGVILLEFLIWLRLRKHQPDAPAIKPALARGIAGFLVLLLIVGLYLWVRTTVLGGLTRGEAATVSYNDNPSYGAPTAFRIYTAIRTQGEYILSLFWPNPLVADYSFNAVPLAKSLLDLNVLIGLAILLGMLMLFIIGLADAPILAFAAGFYLLTMSLTSNIPFPIGTLKAERLLYLPSFGFCLALAFVFDKLWAALRDIPFRALLAVVFLFLCGTYFSLTWDRNPVWKNDYTLFSDTLKWVPNNVKAHINVANGLMTEGRIDDAIQQLQTALIIQPDSAFGLCDLASFTARKAAKLEDEATDLAKSGQKQQALALGQQAQALNIDAEKKFRTLVGGDDSALFHNHMNFTPAYQCYGIFLCNLHRYDDGLALLEKAHELAPKDLDTLHQIYYWFWWAAGNSPHREEYLHKCIDYANIALQLAPSDADADANAGVAYFELGDYAAARDHLVRAIRNNKQFADQKSYNVLASAYYHLNEFKPAEQVCDAALKLNPHDAETQGMLKHILEAERTGRRVEAAPASAAAVK